MQDIQEIKPLFSRSAAIAEKWMLRYLAEENITRRKIQDPVSFYKWPLTLAAKGREPEASDLLWWINKNCLTEDGDYLSDRSGFHREFHIYSTLWLVLAAIRLGDHETVEKAMGFVINYHNPVTGGVATFPAEDNIITEDLVTSAFLGMVACELNDPDLADKVLQFVEKAAGQNLNSDIFRVRFDTDGNAIKTIPDGADIKTYEIKLGKKEESYYFLGAACFFLARYMETFKIDISGLAYKYCEILEKAGGGALHTIWAAKGAPGCIALYSNSGDKRFLSLAEPVIDAVISSQHPDGYWVKNGRPWVTVSAEQCYWLTLIARRL